jgi:hypothetical protein
LTPTQIALIAGGLLLVIGFVLWIAVGIQRGNPDKLSDAAATQVQPEIPDLVQRCSAQSTYDLIKTELFRRAATFRSGDRAQFDQVASAAVLRMERPVLENDDGGAGVIACSGSITLDLPPGIATVDGRNSLAADIGYSLQRSADGNGDVVTLTGVDNLLVQLAGLTKIAPAATTPSVPVDPLSPAPAIPHPPGASPPPVIIPAPPPVFAARPSFNCTTASSRGEMAVCADPNLAALDRQMAAQYGAALRAADPATRAALQRSGARFIAYRNQCPSTACIADTYRGRIREIRDISSGVLR